MASWNAGPVSTPDSREVIPLTVIIPVHDRQPGVDRALASILGQDVLPEAVIVVDDGSHVPVRVDSTTRDALNVTVMRHAANRGPAASRNTGMKAATSDWISFVDSDDALCDHTLGDRWRFVETRCGKQDDAPRTIFACGWEERTVDGDPVGTLMPACAVDPLDFASGCWFSPGSCVIMNRNAVLRIGGQDEQLRRLEDLDWFLGLSLAGFRLAVSPVVGVVVERKRLQATAKVEESVDFLRGKWLRGGLRPKLLRRLNAYLDLEIAAAHYYAGHTIKASAFLARSFMRRPRSHLHLSPGYVRDFTPLHADNAPLAKRRGPGPWWGRWRPQ